MTSFYLPVVLLCFVQLVLVDTDIGSILYYPIQTRGGGQIMPLTLLPAPLESRNYLRTPLQRPILVSVIFRGFQTCGQEGTICNTNSKQGFQGFSKHHTVAPNSSRQQVWRIENCLASPSTHYLRLWSYFALFGCQKKSYVSKLGI